MNASRGLQVCAILIALTLSKTFSLAGPRAKSPSPGEEPFAPEGIEFTDPRVAEAMEMFREGRAPDAMQLLNSAAAQATGEASEELKLGLAMLYLRTGQKPKAMAALTRYAPMKQDTRITRRARLLMRVADHKQHFGGNAPDLLEGPAWNKALGLAGNGIVKDIHAEHQKLFSCIAREDWKQLAAHLAAAQSLVQQAREIKTGESAREAVLAHLDGLHKTIRQISSDLDGGIAHAKQLKIQARDLERPRRTRVPGTGAPDPMAKVKHNELAVRLGGLWQAGRSLVEEYESLVNDEDIPRKARKPIRYLRESQLPKILP